MLPAQQVISEIQTAQHIKTATGDANDSEGVVVHFEGALDLLQSCGPADDNVEAGTTVEIGSRPSSPRTRGSTTIQDKLALAGFSRPHPLIELGRFPSRDAQ